MTNVYDNAGHLERLGALAWLGWALHIVRDRCPDVLTSHQYDCAEQAYKSGFDPSGRAKDEVLARENEDLKRRLAELEKQQPVNERLVEALLYWRDECRGAEPSLSVFARMADEALAAARSARFEFGETPKRRLGECHG